MKSDTAILPATESAPARPREQSRPLRLALVCDFLEEGWPSMDLFGDMFLRCFETEHLSEFRAEQLRPALRPRFSKLAAAGGREVLWNLDRLVNRFVDYPRWLRKRASNFDLFHLMDHSYGQLILDLPPDRTVVTCHDLDTFRCLLEPALEPRPRWFRAMAEKTLRGFRLASQVICPSAATRTNLLRQGWFPPDRVTVIPPGADPVFFAPPETQARQDAKNIVGGDSQTYLLHVGSTIARKRIDVLLRVFARVVKQFPDVRLLRVGGAFSNEQARLASELGLNGKIVQTPFLTKAQLAAVYNGAAGLLQTSDAEGFGLPVIEAMACGCPVVASDILPLREAGGRPTEYCPVGDIDPWSETLIRLLDERTADPARWEQRKDEARRHAAAFTWSANVKQTIAIYQRVWNQGARS